MCGTEVAGVFSFSCCLISKVVCVPILGTEDNNMNVWTPGLVHKGGRYLGPLSPVHTSFLQDFSMADCDPDAAPPKNTTLCVDMSAWFARDGLKEYQRTPGTKTPLLTLHPRCRLLLW